MCLRGPTMVLDKIELNGFIALFLWSFGSVLHFRSACSVRWLIIPHDVKTVFIATWVIRVYNIMLCVCVAGLLFHSYRLRIGSSSFHFCNHFFLFFPDRRCIDYERKEIQHLGHPEQLQYILSYIAVFDSVVRLQCPRDINPLSFIQPKDNKTVNHSARPN